VVGVEEVGPRVGVEALHDLVEDDLDVDWGVGRRASDPIS
jgi:hypothetical protein